MLLDKGETLFFGKPRFFFKIIRIKLKHLYPKQEPINWQLQIKTEKLLGSA